GPKNHSPPIVGRAEHVRAPFRSGGEHLDTCTAEEITQRARFTNPVPRVEALVQVGLYATHCVPEHRVHRLEDPRSLFANAYPPSGTHQLPKLSHCTLHVWHEENAEHTDNRVERRARQVEIEDVPLAKRDVRKAALLCLRAGEIKQVLRKVNAEHRPAWADRLCSRYCQGSAAAACVEDMPSGCKIQAGDAS